MTSWVDETNVRLSLHDKDVLANTAMLYYKEGLTQSEIARRLGVSRPTVINYLRLAREQKIVDIRINGSSFATSNLSGKLREKLGLDDVYIADFTPDGDNLSSEDIRSINRMVAHVGAMALHDILKPGQVVGIGWGDTIQHLAESAPYTTIENLSICQLIGTMPSSLSSTGEKCAFDLASRLGATCHTLHAPAVLTSAKLAEELRAEPVIRDQLARFATLDGAIFSVGECNPETAVSQSAITTREEFEWYRAKGAVGSLCGRFIDKNGVHIAGPMDDRMIAIGLDDVQTIGSGILVVGGKHKIPAILATIAGGYVSHLVIDKSTAKRLLIS